MVGIGWDHSCNCFEIVRAWCLVSIVSAFDIVETCCASCLSLWARVSWSQIWTCYCFMKIIVVFYLTCKLYTHIVVRNLRPQSDNNWDNQRGWMWCEDHMCSWSVNALLRYSIKRSTLITSSFPWGPTANGLVGQKMSCKFLIASTYDYIRNTCLWLLSTRMLYLYLSAIALVLIITWIILSMQRPFIHPYAYSIKSHYLLSIPLLSLFYYCCYYFTTGTTIKLLLLINCCEQVCFQV
jgi:hypothetical protein